MTRLTAKEEGGDVFSRERSFCNLSSERKSALGVSGTARLCSILLNFCFIKRKTTSGQAEAALWSRPRLTTIPRHDALTPPECRLEKRRPGNGMACHFGNVGRARIGVLVICSRERHDF